jgi:hypothetical protein
LTLVPQEQPFSPHHLELVCGQLGALLQAGDAEAELYVEEHAQLLRGAFGPGYGALLRQVQLFEVDEARSSLASLMQQAGVVVA